jgi:hypothetical protein
MPDCHGENRKPAEGGPRIGCEVNRTDTGVPRGVELRRVLAGITEHIEQLDRAMSSLPHVNKEGGSECGFAEDLFAQKEELEREVIEDANRLLGDKRSIDHDVARCRNNRARIQVDSGKLNRDEARDCYSRAEEAAEREYREAVQDKDAISIVLARAQAVLKVSATRKYPGREPQRQSPPAGPGAPEGPDPRTPAAGIGRELDGLLSIGPLEETPSE